MKKRVILAVLSLFLPFLVATPAHASGFTVSNVSYDPTAGTLNFDYSGFDFSSVPEYTQIYLFDETIGTNVVAQGQTYGASDTQCTATHCAFGVASRGLSYQDTDTFFIRVLGYTDSNTFSLTPTEAPPVTTAGLSPNPYSDGTYPDPTTVTLSAIAASGYTIANTYYTIDGGSQQTYSSPFTVIGAGNHTITYWSVDNEGEQESSNSKTFIISETTPEAPPVTTASLSPNPFNDGTYNNPTTVTLSATAASGYSVANTYYTIDGGSQQTYSSPFTITGAGSHTITYWSVDNEGKQELPNSQSFTIGTFTVSNVSYDPTAGTLNFDYSDFDFSSVPEYTQVYLIDETIGTNAVAQGQTYGASDTQCTATHCTFGVASRGLSYQNTDTFYFRVLGYVDSNTFSLTPTELLSGTVYTDTNHNGVQDNGELGYQGATVTVSQNNQTVASTTTDSNGSYSFSSLQSGTYSVAVTLPNGDISTTSNPANVDVTVDTTQNFGIAPATTTLTPTQNSFIKHDGQNQNNGASPFLELSYEGKDRALVQFNETQIQNAIGDDPNYTATLQFTIVSANDNFGSSGRQVDVDRMEQAWVGGNGTYAYNGYRGTGSGVTWDCSIDSNIANESDNCSGSTAWDMLDAGSYPFDATSTATGIITNNETGTVSFNVTSDVQSFLNGTANDGWIVKKDDETKEGDVQFGGLNSSYRPKLIITDH